MTRSVALKRKASYARASRRIKPCRRAGAIVVTSSSDGGPSGSDSERRSTMLSKSAMANTILYDYALGKLFAADVRKYSRSHLKELQKHTDADILDPILLSLAWLSSGNEQRDLTNILNDALPLKLPVSYRHGIDKK